HRKLAVFLECDVPADGFHYNGVFPSCVIGVEIRSKLDSQAGNFHESDFVFDLSITLQHHSSITQTAWRYGDDGQCQIVFCDIVIYYSYTECELPPLSLFREADNGFTRSEASVNAFKN